MKLLKCFEKTNSTNVEMVKLKILNSVRFTRAGCFQPFLKAFKIPLQEFVNQNNPASFKAIHQEWDNFMA